MIFASLCLIVASTAFWFNRYIFESSNFTAIVTTSISSDSSREALATEITDRVLENKPILKNLIDDQAIKLVSALLESDQAQKIQDRAVSKLHTIVTSENPQPIEIELGPIKTALSVAASVSSFSELF